jgi:hypothetical protein
MDDSDHDLSKWPVAQRCTDLRNELAKTHYVVPIEAYGKSGRLIPPHEYETRLPGAVVEANFGLVHHYIRGKKKSVFVTSLRRLRILRPGINFVKSPVKKRRKVGEITNN